MMGYCMIRPHGVLIIGERIVDGANMRRLSFTLLRYLKALSPIRVM